MESARLDRAIGAAGSKAPNPSVESAAMFSVLSTVYRVLSGMRARSMRENSERRRRYRNQAWTAVEVLEDRTLLAGNTAPVAPDAAAVTTAGQSVSITLHVSDAETPANQLTVAIVSTSH